MNRVKISTGDQHVILIAQTNFVRIATNKMALARLVYSPSGEVNVRTNVRNTARITATLCMENVLPVDQAFGEIRVNLHVNMNIVIVAMTSQENANRV